MIFAEADIEQVRATRQVLIRDAQQTGALFYETLFALRPELRALFPDDLSDQNRKFATTLAVISDSARDMDSLKPVLESLARRHLAYSVKPQDYELVGTALQQAFVRMGLTDEQVASWTSIYKVVSEYMIATAYRGH
ncbi:globin domain-containing protein [Roseibium sp. Sym1]|uniref:globin domain-containing protein n=1 Tax=Roseibium sp. Sym1 TaxID=3016006 RepID=UPI0022B41149|nr:globin domain-containing protein [Roseibium sp. Sym1]